jgi:pimeloyl-ACP methyl ester carboxylesterase
MRIPPVFMVLLHLFLLTACHQSGNKLFMPGEKTYKEGFVKSEKIRLHYLDWGGDGPTLVLICGLGDTPFLFEHLAEQLSPRFRIIAYSRRNHYKSETDEQKYDNETLVADLKLLLDSLKIDKASLLGWSMGGNEITGFASQYPHRVDKLIYFEAGYDLSDGGFANLVSAIPKPFLPDSMVMTSLDNFREWYHKFWFGDMEWNGTLEANLQASITKKHDGSIETIPDNNVFNSILKEAMNYRRTYEFVEAPALVIYTKQFFHPADNNPETIRLYDSLENNVVSPWRLLNKKRIEKELRNAIIVNAPKGSHTSFLFLSNDFLVKTISSFLDDEK